MAPKPGTPLLHKEGLASATKELSAALRGEFALRPSEAVLDHVARRILRVYLTKAKNAPDRGDRLHKGTRQLMEMAVGAEIVVPAQAPQVFRSRMKTARRHMSNQDARWKVKLISTTEARIRRLADGAPYETDPMDTPRVVFLAGMAVGEKKLGTIFKSRQSISNGLKVSARKLMKAPGADWSAKTTPTGILVTRTK